MPCIAEWPELVSAERLAEWSTRQCSPMTGERFRDVSLAMLELAKSENLIQPQATYQLFDVAKSGDDWVRLENGDEIADAPAAAKVIAKAQSLIAAVVTIGDRLERRVSSLFSEKKTLKAFALEEIGVSAQFELSTALAERLAGEAGTLGLQCSSALFPGNDGFDLKQQSTVFKLAGGKKIGMRLSESAMLYPVKSASMIFGFGKKMPSWERTKDCETCKAREKCRFRRDKAAA
jgi:cobalamin-dependent methionine synthase I